MSSLKMDIKKDKIRFIKGARKIGPKNQYLVSSGIGALDAILGGGLAVGSLLLIEEDEFGTYAKLMLKHFLSEGIVCSHPLLIASQNVDLKHLVSELPSPVNDEPFSEPKHDSQLNVAWRYQEMPKFNSAPSNISPLTNVYDVTSYINQNKIKNSTMYFFDRNKRNYSDVLKYIYETLQNGKYNLADSCENRNILRIGLHSLGTVLWEGDIVMFLHSLRAIIRNYYVTCIVTIPTRVFKELYIIDRCEHMCDTVLKLESLVNKGNPAYSEYKGLLFLKKLPALNNWNFRVPETADWGFKLQKKLFLIEKLHISPDLGESMNREEEDIATEYLPER